MVNELQQGPIPSKALISMAIFFHEHDTAAKKEEDKKDTEDLELELCAFDTPQLKAFFTGRVIASNKRFDIVSRCSPKGNVHHG